MSEPLVIGEASVPRLARGTRLQFDKHRDQWIVQAPERFFVLDPIALEIVQRCDGVASVTAIVDDLAAKFNAPREIISRDVNNAAAGFRRQTGDEPMNPVSPPLALLAELTHRCPLQCPYCSNPLNLERASQELTTAEWTRAIDEAAAMGVLQIHFSGGEPTVRPDLEELVRHAHDGGALYQSHHCRRAAR